MPARRRVESAALRWPIGPGSERNIARAFSLGKLSAEGPRRLRAPGLAPRLLAGRGHYESELQPERYDRSAWLGGGQFVFLGLKFPLGRGATSGSSAQAYRNTATPRAHPAHSGNWRPPLTPYPEIAMPRPAKRRRIWVHVAPGRV